MIKILNSVLKYNIVLFVSIILCSCEDFLEPLEETGKYDDNMVWNNPNYAEGVLLAAYGILQTDYVCNEEYVADDAVINEMANVVRTMATGGWTSKNNPIDDYANYYQAILQINDFLEHVNNVPWYPSSNTLNDLYRQRLKGEAFGLRAYFYSLLLQKVGGKTSSGELLGFPIVLSSNFSIEDSKINRSTYKACVKQIFEDCDSALTLLPNRWTNDGLNADEQKAIGEKYMNRINGMMVRLIKARVALLAASESFAGSGISMEDAAKYAAEIITLNGLDNLQYNDIMFYNQATNLKDLSYFKGNSEIFWSSAIVSKSSIRELNHFPPSLFGKAKLNPSQNLVDAFGDSYGYPISVSPIYDENNPYVNRDPRFYSYIFYNGSVTSTGNILDIKNGDKDKIGATLYSTRTGYYLRKLLDENVSLEVGVTVQTPHYYVYGRYTEALLIFAEAANNAVGPDGVISGYTARNIINAIRSRAGIFNMDYVNNLSDEDFTELIKNERRIELCFEGFRFWDLRRWGDVEKMNEPVKGIDLETMSPFEVENRDYKAYMIYGPIPYNEILKYDLIQNNGW